MNKTKFYEVLRTSLYSKGLPQTAVDSLDRMIDEGEARGIPLAQLAYIMATAYHELTSAMTPHTENLNYTTAARIKTVWPSRFKTVAAAQPYVKNAQKLANFVYGGRLGNTGSNDGWTYRGRGHIQTTGKVNYEKLSKVVGVDLVKYPEKALEIDISIISLVHGMITGMYTGKKLSDYNLPAQYYDARAIVNADKSRKEGNTTVGQLIASYAVKFEAALKAGDYTGNKTPSTTEVTEFPKFPDLLPTNDSATNIFEVIINLFKLVAKLFKK